MSQNISDAAFPLTRWSILARLDESDHGVKTALEELCRVYRAPLYSFARYQGHSPSDAEDLVQGFLAKAATNGLFRKADEDRGKLRTFLLTAFRRFMRDEFEKATALKRGAGKTHSMDVAELEEWYVDEDTALKTPESAFDRRWAVSVLENTILTLSERWREKGKLDEFSLLRPFLTESGSADDYAEVGKKSGTSSGTVKVRIHRLRATFAALLREQVALTIESEEDVDDELRYLIELI